ncbi:MAG: hypothetical protein R2851_28225 [Caldilineaceae bacterium]
MADSTVPSSSAGGDRTLSLAERMVLPNMMAEFGAKNAYVPAPGRGDGRLSGRKLGAPARA